jgi:1-acyl-sn-glycerol-3-phosphate acyltransferase
VSDVQPAPDQPAVDAVRTERGPGLTSRLLWKLLGVVFRLKGWRVSGNAPAVRKYVLIGAPHTSNWDFVFFAGTVQQLGIRPSFIGKHTLFHWPLRRFMYDMGGMPIDRSKPGGYTRSVIRAFAQASEMALVIAPEGTRKSSGEWRSGFYHIAMGAGVPIVPAWVDHARKQGGIGAPIMPSGDYAADMAQLLAFFRKVMPDCPRWAVLEASIAAAVKGNGNG